ncbi:uncharacterized protein LOC133471306 isoform X3 [Phyllopteryx taeniolatus]|uniref:uncharacterized protein LOC133471306 isoform X3 n=1 Tax=Phyllopteryx taeniolatus TaxID=161469 RepID=UPI002AD4B6C1|nr:uncharacterized protein LOC133471306 isoform X3 [Phyllopteryx taeniolatus]
MSPTQPTSGGKGYASSRRSTAIPVRSADKKRVAGVLEPIPAIIGQEAGYTLDWSPANRRAHIKNGPRLALPRVRGGSRPEERQGATHQQPEQGTQLAPLQHPRNMGELPSHHQYSPGGHPSGPPTHPIPKIRKE